MSIMKIAPYKINKRYLLRLSSKYLSDSSKNKGDDVCSKTSNEKKDCPCKNDDAGSKTSDDKKDCLCKDDDAGSKTSDDKKDCPCKDDDAGSKTSDDKKDSPCKGDDSGSDTSDDKKDCPCNDNPSTPSMYDCRKYGHNLPCNNIVPNFETLPYIPTGIFRYTCGESLGCGANKCSSYKNPEYFSYQHMTFYDMHLILKPCRQPSPITGRKP